MDVFYTFEHVGRKSGSKTSVLRVPLAAVGKSYNWMQSSFDVLIIQWKTLCKCVRVWVCVCIYFTMISQFNKPNNVFHTKSVFDGKFLDSFESVALHYCKVADGKKQQLTYACCICVEQVFVFAFEKSADSRSSVETIESAESKITTLTTCFYKHFMKSFTWCNLTAHFRWSWVKKKRKDFGWTDSSARIHTKTL